MRTFDLGSVKVSSSLQAVGLLLILFVMLSACGAKDLSGGNAGAGGVPLDGDGGAGSSSGDGGAGSSSGDGGAGSSSGDGGAGSSSGDGGALGGGHSTAGSGGALGGASGAAGSASGAAGVSGAGECVCPAGNAESVGRPLECFCQTFPCPASFDAALAALVNDCDDGRVRVRTGCGQKSVSVLSLYGESYTYADDSGELVGASQYDDVPHGDCDAFEYVAGVTNTGCTDAVDCSPCADQGDGGALPACP